MTESFSDSPVSSMSGSAVQLTAQQWQQAADAANQCAEALDNAHSAAVNTLRGNWFGTTPIEGPSIYDRLKQRVNDGDNAWAGALVAESQYLRKFAAECESAQQRLFQADSSSASGIPS
ncbi:hypothetical protein [Williamsia sterculiae]|uniref:hypothetical protein n=1 Tax=Williamsia sterculiae TaxID=1344003 RepID=UPI00117E311C|nr:hypothetical protein [Williamsia sterculiae]